MRGFGLTGDVAARKRPIVPLIVYAVTDVIRTLVGRRLPGGEAGALVYGTVMRNLSIALPLLSFSKT